MLIVGIVSLFMSISLIITSVVYPLIPKLYRLFEKLSTFEFLSNDYIQSVWNNIYVLVGVVVLFAIAIKLISTIVNPDTLSDNKKGVKGFYFRTVAAVVLIFIIPIIFSYSFQLQQKLVESNFLISRVFGFKLAEGTDAGQLLAWQAFSSFCEPTDKVTEQGAARYNAAKQNIENIGPLLINIKINDPFNTPFDAEFTDAYNYHSILCPLAGIVIVYELFLLCMDTLFRAAKLSFLELMLPIVLGAFVFNPDILKKWAREFFATYLSLFLKLLAIGFMIISLASIREYVEGDAFFSEWLLQGLFNILFIIALLQLVKKIPDLINSIFGTHIKTSGGIKGRLGEMAGIGGIAQNAWTSLGGLAKGLGATAAIGALGAVGVGAKAGFDAISNSQTKAGHIAKGIKDTYGKLKNGQVGRVASTMSAGIKTKGKGTGKAMLESWNKNPISVSSAKAQQLAANAETNRELGLTETGMANYENPEYNMPFKRNTKGDYSEAEERRRVQTELNFNKGKSDVAAANIAASRRKTASLNLSKAETDRINSVDTLAENYAKHSAALANMKKGQGILDNTAKAIIADQDARQAFDGLVNSVGLDASLFKLDPDTKKTRAVTPHEYKEWIIQELADKDLDKHFPNSATRVAAISALVEGVMQTYGSDVRSISALEKASKNDEAQLSNIESIIESGLPNTGTPIEIERTKQDVKSIIQSKKQWYKEKVDADSKYNFINSEDGQDIAFDDWRNSPTSQGPAPQGPAPQGPIPQGPAPQGPIPQGPAPQGPAPQGPIPQGPASQGPAPQGPVSQGPAPQGAAVNQQQTGNGGPTPIIQQTIHQNNKTEVNIKGDSGIKASDVRNMLNNAVSEINTHTDAKSKEAKENIDSQAREIRSKQDKMKAQQDDIEKKIKKDDNE